MKKNLIILVAVLLTSTFAFAQSGNMFVTGHLGFNTNSSTNSVGSTSVDIPGGNTFDIMAEFHYKITKNIAVGLGLDYERYSSFVGTTPGGTDYFNSESMFSIVPSAIYGIKITDNFKYIPRLYLAIGFGSIDEESPAVLDPNKIETFTTDLSSFTIGVKPLSFEYGINNRFAITMSFGDLYYRTYTEKATIANIESKATNKGFNLDANYGASFGIRIYL
ncbi:MAG: hypothetical protein H6Q16_662 [Bacteroidetes bacterium]|nr:hypothetical protein [Bacteroidota bacterium]